MPSGQPSQETVVDPSLKSDTDHRPDSYPSRSTYDQDILGEFIDMDETCLMGEPTMVAKAATQEDGGLKPPALPQRSSLRTSKLLDNFKLAQAEPEPSLKTTPHDIYLSSEEDASSSADDFSDDECESGSEKAQEAVIRRGSQEDTARVVSVIYSGKPCIVHLGGSRRSSSPDSTSSRSQTSCHEEALSMLEAKSPPARQSSLLSLETRPSFLNIDPFADVEYPSSPKKDDDFSPRTPRTPSMMFNKMQKTLGLVRKRSRPMLHNLAAASRESFVSFGTSTSSTNLAAGSTQDESRVLQRSSTMVPSPSSPARYSDFMKSSRKKSFTAPQPQPSPMTPHGPVVSKKPLLSGFSLARRKSIKS